MTAPADPPQEDPLAPVTTRLTVDGIAREVAAPARLLLSDALRGLGATGVNVGCEQGACGACTVLIDGRPAYACLVLAVQADGSSIETVASGAGGAGGLDEVQQAMRRRGALQCGFCTPGIVTSLRALRAAGGPADEEGLRDALRGHLCRCTGYQQLLQAARDALGGEQGGRP